MSLAVGDSCVVKVWEKSNTTVMVQPKGKATRETFCQRDRYKTNLQLVKEKPKPNQR